VFFQATLARDGIEVILKNLLNRVPDEFRHGHLLLEREAPQVLVAVVVHAHQQPFHVMTS
jgi:hypothetical protein